MNSPIFKYFHVIVAVSFGYIAACGTQLKSNIDNFMIVIKNSQVLIVIYLSVCLVYLFLIRLYIILDFLLSNYLHFTY